MKLNNYQIMDPHLLLGLVNTALRNEAEDLEDLVRQHDVDSGSLQERLRAAGYVYVPAINQFRTVPDP